MKRNMSPMSVALPAPQTLNAEAVERAIQSIIYNYNLLAEDQHRTYEMALETKKAHDYTQARVDYHAKAFDDLNDLIDFLEKNPGADLKDWVRYEAVKEQFRKATGNVG